MENWVITAKKADFKMIAAKYGIDQVTARLIRNRDIVGDEEIEKYLHGGLDMLPSFRLLKDIDKAEDLLKDKIKEKKKIRIIGDYDIDGVMASYILLKGFQRIGAKVDVMIPDRMTDGYGLNESLIRRAHEDGIDTIVTCDNGISAAQQILLAKELKMDVVVTDHHEIPFLEQEGERREILPEAKAVVDPKRSDCSYPFKGICGAVVAAQLVAALYEEMGIPSVEMEAFLEYEAIATIGDVMDLQADNRILVREGLKRLKNSKNLGLQALMEVTGIDPEHIAPYHIGFVLGPCLNAAGRLETAKLSLALLCADTPDKAKKMAEELKALNEERKSLTNEGVESAIAMIEGGELAEDKVLVVYLPKCHESIAGIIAGRIRERYHKPCFVITKAKDGLKGSGRSIEAYSMFERLTEVADLLDKFGGHPLAAGLSLQKKNLNEFRRRLNENCGLTEENLREKVVIDMAMPFAYVSMELVREFSLLEPFGKGNSKPIFAQKDLLVRDCRTMGNAGRVAKMQLLDQQGHSCEGIYFGDAQEFINTVKKQGKIDIVYYPEINSWRGKESLQMVIQRYR